jgi:hypothetical protein
VRLSGLDLLLSVEGYCEDSDETLFSIKFRKFLEELASQERLHLFGGKKIPENIVISCKHKYYN